jgi:hypothetical protein
MTDASFEDGAERPLALTAQDADDVQVMSSLLQDAVFTAADLTYDRKRREFAVLLNRFRWEDREGAEKARRGYERVRAILLLRDALTVRSQGIEPGNKDMVLSLLSLSFAPSQDGMGALTLVLAGDGLVEVQVEALDVTLRDVTRPYLAPSRKAPRHEG